MKKLFILLALLILLSGCSSNKVSDLQSRLENVANSYYKLEAGNHKKYYSYFMQPSGRAIESTKTSSLLQFDNVEVILNINVSDIINAKYYKNANANVSATNENILVNSFSGTYIDKFSETYDYNFKLYQVGKEYLAVLQTPYVYLYSIVYEGDVLETAINMMVIAKSVNVDTAAIIKDYSNLSQIDYVKEQIQLFEVVIPENGRIEEILLDTLDYDQIIDDTNEFGPNGNASEVPTDIEIEEQDTD